LERAAYKVLCHILDFVLALGSRSKATAIHCGSNWQHSRADISLPLGKDLKYAPGACAFTCLPSGQQQSPKFVGGATSRMELGIKFVSGASRTFGQNPFLVSWLPKVYPAFTSSMNELSQ
jgi:hypothetical protein